MTKSTPPSTSPAKAPQVPQTPRWRIALALGTTALVMALLFDQVGGLKRSAEALKQARWEYLPIALGILGMVLVLSVLKWRVVLRAMGYTVSFRQGLFAFMASLPIAAITPSRAGDFFRASVLAPKVPILRGLSSVIADRLVDIQSLCLLAIGGALLTQRYVEASLVTGGLALAWAILLLLLWRRETLLGRWPLVKVQGAIEELLEAFVSMLRQPPLLIAQLAYSMCIWCLVLSVFYTLSLVFQCGISPVEVLALWPLATLFGLIPLTLSGMGTRDAAFVFMLVEYGHTGLNQGAVLLATFAYALISSWLWALLGLPAMIRWLAGSSALSKGPSHGLQTESKNDGSP